jgi:transposase, IS30 family
LSYKQLTREQRYQIYALKKAGHKQTPMAAILGVHKSTISREMRRNQGGRGYRPKQAQEWAKARKQARVRQHISHAIWKRIEQLLLEQWSPEQISGRLKLEGQATVSHERIYQYIYQNKRRGGTLCLNLRSQKKRRKRYGHYDRRGQLRGRRSIEERPQIVAQRKRRGDWEADTIIGRNHQGALVSLVERKSKLVRLARVARPTAAAVGHAIIAQLEPLTVHTITSDNGREFANHHEIERSLEIKFYFAHPYSSWERGTNENTNGLVRQYFPKKHDFATITDDQLADIVERLNARPRKTLGYKTPNEVFFKQPLVALTT